MNKDIARVAVFLIVVGLLAIDPTSDKSLGSNSDVFATFNSPQTAGAPPDDIGPCADNNEEILRMAKSVGMLDVTGCSWVAENGFCAHESFGDVIRQTCSCSCGTATITAPETPNSKKPSSKTGTKGSGKSKKVPAQPAELPVPELVLMEGRWVAEANAPKCCNFIENSVSSNEKLAQIYGTSRFGCCGSDGSDYQHKRWTGGDVSFDFDTFMDRIQGKTITVFGDTLSAQQVAGLICLLELNSITPTAMTYCSQSDSSSNSARCAHPIFASNEFSSLEIFSFDDHALSIIRIPSIGGPKFKAASAISKNSDVVLTSIGAFFADENGLQLFETEVSMVAQWFLETIKQRPEVRMAMIEVSPSHFDVANIPNRNGAPYSKAWKFATQCGDLNTEDRKFEKQRNGIIYKISDPFRIPVLATNYLESRSDAHIENQERREWSEKSRDYKTVTATDCVHFCQNPFLWEPLMAQLQKLLSE